MMVTALLAAGAVEGAALGWAQAHVLGDAVAGLQRRPFVLATVAGAVVAYAIGLIPALFGPGLAQWPTPLVIISGAAAGTALLTTIGTAQWLVLRKVVPRSASWIVTTAGAWAAGLLGFTAVATPLWKPGQPILVVVAIGTLGGLTMAATVAAITGVAAVRLVTHRTRA